MSVSYSTDESGITTATFSGTDILRQNTVTEGLNNSTIVVISGYTSIGSSAFYNLSNILSVTIPDSVTSIDGSAFFGCSSLNSITIPNSVTSIGGSAFSRCSSLASVILPTNNNFSLINSQTFEKCLNLTSITIPNSVTIIGSYAFIECENLVSIIIPEGVIIIGDIAFTACTKLESITLPNSLYVIGGQAFYGCALSSITLPTNNKFTTIGSSAFQACTSLLSLTIPNSVTAINYGAFIYCSGLTTFIAPNSVASIGNNAFDGCIKLESIVLPTNINYTTINNSLFTNCISLTSVIIPSNVITIDSYAFQRCSGLTFLTIPNGVTAINETAFGNASSLETVIISNSVKTLGTQAFVACTSLKNILFVRNSNLTSIGNAAFFNCRGLTSITIPKKVTSIASNAFLNCTNLTKVYISSPNGLNITVPQTNYNFYGKRVNIEPEVVLPLNISNVTPSTGTILGGTTVTINGSNLLGSRVMFGLNNATNISLDSSNTMITCTSPAGNIGSVDITVETPLNSETLTNAFTYGEPPTIISVSNDEGSILGGTNVTIVGINLLYSTVKFGSTDASNIFVDSSGTIITCISPNGIAGLVDIVVTTPYGNTIKKNAFTYKGPPVITNISPNFGSKFGGTIVNIFGNDFSNCTVIFGSKDASNISVDPSGTMITCTSPDGPGGLVAIIITTPYGTTTTNNAFTYLELPVITSISPNVDSMSGGKRITIVGLYLFNSSVKFGQKDASSISVNRSGTIITCTSPDGPAGLVDLIVTTSIGTTTKNNAFTYKEPPVITSISPNFGTSIGGTILTIFGLNLLDSSVKFGPKNATKLSINESGTEITCTSPDGLPGLADVEVTTPYGSITQKDAFTYKGPAIITSVSPEVGSTLGGTSVTIVGKNFSDSSSVKFGSKDVTKLSINESGTIITCTSPNGNGGFVSLEITTPYGVTTKYDAFTYLRPPLITSISPSSGLDLEETTVTIVGRYLSNSTVKFGSKDATKLSINENGTAITCSSPTGSGSVDVEVITPYGNAILVNAFNYGEPPTITSISPSLGLTSGFTNITIVGSGLSKSTVKFGSKDATIISVNESGTIMTCLSPSGNAGLVDVEVTTVYGNAKSNNAFIYGELPTIESISPVKGLTIGDTICTIIGTNLANSSIKFGSNDATIISFNESGTSITCKSPSGISGLVDIKVTTNFGSTTSYRAFNYLVPVTITDISPSFGLTTGGTSVVISGSGLADSNVKFGQTNATNISGPSDGSYIICKSPSGISGLVDIEVISAVDSIFKQNAFRYGEPPTITNISPVVGPTIGGTIVTIFGTNLLNSTIKFGLIDSVDISVNDIGTIITCTSPVSISGLVDVEVTTLYGIATLNDAFTYGKIPVITNITPSQGVTLGETLVKIDGESLSNSIVKFGNKNADIKSINSRGTTITCNSPDGIAGLVDIEDITPFGISTIKNGFTYGEPPSIISISPELGLTSGETLVTIVGTNLSDSIVKFGSKNASIVSFESSGNIITCTSPDGIAGLVNIEAITPFGSAIKNNAFTYGVLPFVLSVFPLTGSTLGGTSITLIGTSLLGTTVKFGSKNATDVSFNSSGTIITCILPDGNAGSKNIEISNVYGSIYFENPFIYREPPTITSISPEYGLAKDFTNCTIIGTGLSNTTVMFGSKSATNVYFNDSGTMITCLSPSESAGVVDVIVNSSYGSGVKSNAFTYGEAPIITSVYPESGLTTGNTIVTIYGTNLSNRSVKFGENNATSVSVNSSGTIITCNLPEGNVGVVDIQVTTVYGSIISYRAFTYVIPVTITSLSPDFDILTGGAKVTIFGTGLTNCSVKFGSEYATGVSGPSNGTYITCNAPPGSSGLVNVEVTTSLESVTKSNAFIYGSSPTITSVSPITGSVKGGTSITIVGTYLLGSTVKIGVKNAIDVYVTPDGNMLTCLSPSKSPGYVDVQVITSFGNAIKSSIFLYGEPPVIKSITPTSGPISGGNTISITGSYLANSIVMIGSKNASIVSFSGSGTNTKITCTSPSGNAGFVNVEVITPFGNNIKVNGYKYV